MAFDPTEPDFGLVKGKLAEDEASVQKIIIWLFLQKLNKMCTLFLSMELYSKLNVDQGRVYCTGLSMGGFGTWELAITYPQLFAAIVPICGGGSPYIAARIRHIPTWVFHGGRDNVVPLYESQRMVDALKRAGANVQLTVYPEAGHDSWTETYNNPDLYTWLLSHRRRPAGTPPTRPG